ncbi:MAG: O-antigen ligase family protein [Caulobacteraceae bacterium]
MAHRRLEIAFVVVAVLLYSNALIGPLFAPDQTASDDLAWLRYLWLPAYAGTAVFCVLRARMMARAWAGLLLFGLVALWVFASANWSIDHEVSTRRGIALIFTTLFGVYVGASFRGGAFVPVLGGCMIALALGSVAMALGYPKLGVHSDINIGDWRGLWYQKNALGGMMAYGVLTCLAASRLSGHRRRWLAGAALCLGLVLMSRSKTALICTLAPAGVFLLVQVARRSILLAVAAVFAAGAAAEGLVAILWLAPDALLKLLGKDPTLTGRTDIWAAIFRQMEHRPLLGYGYGAFWLKDSTPAKFIRAETGWLVPSAHNGWLDVMVQVGWIGMGLVALAVLVALVAAAVRGWRMDDAGWSLCIVIAFTMRSLSESVLISQNSLDWAMFVAATTFLLAPAARARAAQQQPMSRWTAFQGPTPARIPAPAHAAWSPPGHAAGMPTR